MIDHDSAIAYVHKVFAGVSDKAGEPYVVHCVKVANMALNFALKMGMTKREANKFYYVGLFHDVVEDTPITIEELHERTGFPEDIMQGIEAMTHLKGEPYSEYMERVSANKYATLVKMVDMTHNAQIERYSKSDRTEKRQQECLGYGKKLFNLLRSL